MQSLRILPSLEELEIGPIGSGQAFAISLNPSSLDFGDCNYGNKCVISGTLSNISRTSLLIHQFRIIVPFTIDPQVGFSIDFICNSLPYQPIILEPNETLQISLFYEPNAIYNANNIPLERHDMGYFQVEFCFFGAPGCRACDIATEPTVGICERNLRSERPDHSDFNLAKFLLLGHGTP